jgi:hypothetical protein
MRGLFAGRSGTSVAVDNWRVKIAYDSRLLVIIRE